MDLGVKYPALIIGCLIYSGQYYNVFAMYYYFNILLMFLNIFTPCDKLATCCQFCQNCKEKRAISLSKVSKIRFIVKHVC